MLKKSLFIILAIVILLGAFYALIYFNIIKAPAFAQNLPFINQSEGNLKPKSPLDREREENARLKELISSKDNEILSLKKQLEEIEKKEESLEKAELGYKDEIAALQDSLDFLKSKQIDQASAYKNMASYYSEMDSKNAAELIAGLEDEDIIGIFEKMETEVVAEMLQEMPRDKAVNISQKMLVTSTQ